PLENGFCVMLDGIEDPYNFGYALRSLYAAGTDAVILPPRSWMTAAGVVCRASAGASERFPLYAAQNTREAVDCFRAAGYKIICADIAHSVSVYDADLTRPLLLIVGGEKRGISRAVLDCADSVVRLDYGRAFDGALSAASAASILAFEVYRQNRK
ncbi:MAG: 23S rRNA (guanosine(2251)-2'-O)-methyltransferase RlmB, partial [Eubacteriales bacterium]